jgi:peroxiredoxin
MSAVWLCCCLSVLGAQADAGPRQDGIGLHVDDFALRDFRGQEHRLSDFQASKLVVVVFLSVDCPLTKLYGARLGELAKEFESQSVRFIGIQANQYESLTSLGNYANKSGILFPLLRDAGNDVADRFRAKRTPEAFVLDEGRVIRYRGRIDDQFGIGIQQQKVGSRDLADALEELLAGKAVTRPMTAAPGCLISRMTQANEQGEAKTTFTKDIAPILQRRCQECHRPGQIAPFPLTTYKDASGWSAMIREVVEQGRMPPWSADPKHGKFKNDPSLTQGEKKALFDWIDAKCPEGDPADLPAPRQFTEGWNIPRVDQVVSMREPFTVPAHGVVEYQFFEVDPGFKEDRWIQAAEIRPGNRAVVHHCSVFLRPPGSPDLAEMGTLGSFVLAAIAAGTPATVLPDGMAKLVPAGWRFVFVLHYVTVGTEQKDQTSLALMFADPKTVRKEVATKVMFDLDLQIPPNEANHSVSQTWRINDDVLLLAMVPHMHLRGKSFRYEAIFPDGDVEILLDVPHYDFNWQHRYVLAEPRRLPAGSFIRCTAVYDNSTGNEANPDPSVTVHTGSQTWDEMFNGYFDVVLADQDLTVADPWYAKLWATSKALCSPAFAVLTVAGGSVFLGRRRLGKLLIGPPGLQST